MPKTPFERNGKMCVVVRRERQRLGLTQEQLADRIGVQKNTIGLIERDKTGMRRKTADDLMRLFECDEAYLRGESSFRTAEEREMTQILNQADVTISHYQIVTWMIMQCFKWKMAGTAGMLMTGSHSPFTPGDPYDSVPYFTNRDNPREVPDGYTYHPQYYVFDTPDGKCAIPCMEYTKFTGRVISFAKMELNNLTESTPVVPGWEYYLPTDDYGTVLDDSIVRAFDEAAASGFKRPVSLMDSLNLKNRATALASMLPQQDDEKGEEQ